MTKRPERTFTYKSFWAGDRFGVTKFLQELHDAKNQYIVNWQIVDSVDNPANGYLIFVEIYSWKKKKK